MAGLLGCLVSSLSSLSRFCCAGEFANLSSDLVADVTMDRFNEIIEDGDPTLVVETDVDGPTPAVEALVDGEVLVVVEPVVNPEGQVVVRQESNPVVEEQVVRPEGKVSLFSVEPVDDTSSLVGVEVQPQAVGLVMVEEQSTVVPQPGPVYVSVLEQVLSVDFFPADKIPEVTTEPLPGQVFESVLLQTLSVEFLIPEKLPELTTEPLPGLVFESALEPTLSVIFLECAEEDDRTTDEVLVSDLDTGCMVSGHLVEELGQVTESVFECAEEVAEEPGCVHVGDSSGLDDTYATEWYDVGSVEESLNSTFTVETIEFWDGTFDFVEYTSFDATDCWEPTVFSPSVDQVSFDEWDDWLVEDWSYDVLSRHPTSCYLY